MTPTDAELRKALNIMRIWISEDAHLGESTISYELERAEGLRKLDAIEQAIAATVGVGTCKIEERHGDWYCTGCGEMVGTCDTASELCIDGNAIELWRHCPNCGKRIKEEAE